MLPIAYCNHLQPSFCAPEEPLHHRCSDATTRRVGSPPSAQRRPEGFAEAARRDTGLVQGKESMEISMEPSLPKMVVYYRGRPCDQRLSMTPSDGLRTASRYPIGQPWQQHRYNIASLRWCGSACCPALAGTLASTAGTKPGMCGWHSRCWCVAVNTNQHQWQTTNQKLQLVQC